MFIRALRLKTFAVGLESRKLGHRIGVVGGVEGLGGKGRGRWIGGKGGGEGAGRRNEEQLRH